APAALPSGPVRISPKARRLAKELGVDVSRLFGSGPDGEIVASDVQSAAKSATPPARPVVQPPPPLPSAALGEMTSIGRLMAERTTQSWTTVPHFFVTREAEGTALVAVREKAGPAVERSKGVKLTYTDLLTA